MHQRFCAIWATFLVLSAMSLAGPISVSEINYNPLDSSDYEFVELLNPGTTPFVLTGCKFTAGIDFVFPAGVLAPGARVVVARDLGKFAERYPGISAKGPYSKKLNDSGDTLILTSAGGVELIKMKYDTTGNWPSRAYGLGSSLEVIDPNGDLSDPLNWRSSTEYHGSPGVAGIGPLNTIVINEVLAHTDPPIEDALELYNRAATNVDISNWYISNQRSDPKKFHIPPGTVLAPHTFKVFYEQRGVLGVAGFNTSITGNKPDFTFNSAHGDDAVILSTTGGTHLQYWVDAVSFDSSEHGYSFGRYPDFTGPMVVMDHLTLGSVVDDTYPAVFLPEFRKGNGASNSLPRVGPLVFNRIMYHPLTNQDEFIELLNIASTNVPLYDLLHVTNTWSLHNAVDYQFPSGVNLGPGAKLLVVPVAPAIFRARYSIPAGVQVYGPYTNALSGSGETIALYKPDPPQEPPHPDAGYVPQILVEKISYSSRSPWPAGANGTGPALLRLDPHRYGNDPANWTLDGAAPSLPPSLSFSRSASGGILLSFVAAPNRGYVVETAADLSVGSGWTAWRIVDPTGTGATVQFHWEAGALQQFIRIR